MPSVDAPTDRSRVVRLDLRKPTDVIGDDEDVLDALRTRARSRGLEDGVWDLSRVLLVTDGARLRELSALVERLHATVERLLVVLLESDRRDADANGTALAVPAAVERVPLVWISDTLGVMWALEGVRNVDVVVGAPHENRLDHLLAALQVREVFDDVHQRGSQQGLRVSSPGLRALVLNSAAPAAVHAAVESAGREVIGDDVALPDDELGSLAAQHGLAALLGRIREDVWSGGRVDERLRAARLQVERAQGIVGSARWFPPASARLADADDALDQAVDALAQAKADLVQLCQQVDGSDGLSEADLALLRQAGLVERPEVAALRLLGVESPVSTVLNRSVRAFTLSLLSQPASLGYTALRLRQLASRVRPLDSAATLKLVHDVHRDEALEGAGPGARFAATTLRLDLLAAFAAAGALAGLLPSALPIVVLAAACSTAALVAGTLRVTATALRGRRPSLLLPPACVLLAGLAVLAAPSAATLPLEVRAAGPPLGLLLLCIAAIGAWRDALARWQRRRSVAEVSNSVARLRELAGSIAANDWLLADARVRVATLADGLAECLRGVREATIDELELDRSVENGDPPAPPAPRSRSPRGDEAVTVVDLQPHVAEVSDLVAHDLRRLAVDAVQQVWARMSVHATRFIVGEAVDRYRDQLVVYLEGVSREGVISRVPAGDERRALLLGRIWSEALTADELLAARVDDAFVQYCSHSFLRHLSSSPDHAALFVFAPESARAHAPTSRSDVIWTAGAQIAGVLRLVPLRPGAVKYQRR